MMRDDILAFESSVDFWGDPYWNGQPIKDHKGFGALHPQFWELEPPLHGTPLFTSGRGNDQDINTETA